MNLPVNNELAFTKEYINNELALYNYTKLYSVLLGS